MRSEIKEFDMYKAGEYIPNISNKRMTYYKLIDKIPDESLKMAILRQNDKRNRYAEWIALIALLTFVGLGALLGWALTYGYYYNLGLIP